MKTQKKSFRKKALLSSLSMLMVATVAVGSATFAWFTSSTSATAENIMVQTTKSSELQVSDKSLIWGDTVDYGMEEYKTLRPATSSDGENWYSNVAEAKTASTAKSGNAYTQQTGTNLNNYVFVNMLNIKNAGGQECTGVQIKIETTTTSKFARIALVPCDAQTVADTMPTVTTDNFKANIYGAAADDTWKPWTGSALTTEDYTTAAAANNKVVTVGAIPANEVRSYKVLVWFEGEDSDCYDTTTSLLTIPDVKFTVTGSTTTT